MGQATNSLAVAGLPPARGEGFAEIGSRFSFVQCTPGPWEKPLPFVSAAVPASAHSIAATAPSADRPTPSARTNTLSRRAYSVGTLSAATPLSKNRKQQPPDTQPLGRIAASFRRRTVSDRANRFLHESRRSDRNTARSPTAQGTLARSTGGPDLRTQSDAAFQGIEPSNGIEVPLRFAVAGLRPFRVLLLPNVCRAAERRAPSPTPLPPNVCRTSQRRPPCRPTRQYRGDGRPALRLSTVPAIVVPVWAKLSAQTGRPATSRRVAAWHALANVALLNAFSSKGLVQLAPVRTKQHALFLAFWYRSCSQ